MKSLSQNHPEISADWDNPLNADLTPNDVSLNYRKPVWWKCIKGHSYMASPYSRVRSKGCKVCNQPFTTEKLRKAKLAKSRSFASAKPNLLNQWNYVRNVISPDEVSEKSHIEVWWICEKKHEWKSTPQRRFRGDGCPTCSRESAGERVRAWRLKKTGISLFDKHPDLIAEWDYEKNAHDPSRLTPKSGVRAHWVCRFAHKWEATITNRTHNGSGCPLCTNQTSRLEVFLLCELRSLFSKVEWRKKIDGVECDIFIPEISTGIEVDGEYWHCKKIEADKKKAVFLNSKGIFLIRVRDNRLDSIEGVTIQFIHSAPEINACLELVAKINASFPNYKLENYINAGIQVNESDYREIMSRLPAPPKEKSLLELYPSISNEWDHTTNAPLSADLFVPGSSQKVGWVCTKGHKWVASIKNRAENKSACPTCYKEGLSNNVLKSIASRRGSLKSINPNYLQLWDYAKNADIHPEEIHFNSARKIWWRCKKGHEFLRSIQQMNSDSDCEICSSLENCYPDLMSEWAFDLNGTLNPQDFTCKTRTSVWWRCPNQHTWFTSVIRRTGGSSCPICRSSERAEKARLESLKKRGTLADKFPALISYWHPSLNGNMSPSDIAPYSCLDVWWICSSRHEFKNSPSAMTSKFTNEEKIACPICLENLGIHQTDSSFEKTRKLKLLKSGSLADKYPNLAGQWHESLNGDITPSEISPSSHKKIWWICEEGHTWLKSVNYRSTLIQRGSSFGCPICSKSKKPIL